MTNCRHGFFHRVSDQLRKIPPPICAHLIIRGRRSRRLPACAQAEHPARGRFSRAFSLAVVWGERSGNWAVAIVSGSLAGSGQAYNSRFWPRRFCGVTANLEVAKKNGLTSTYDKCARRRRRMVDFGPAVVVRDEWVRAESSGRSSFVDRRLCDGRCPGTERAEVGAPGVVRRLACRCRIERTTRPAIRFHRTR